MWWTLLVIVTWRLGSHCMQLIMQGLIPPPPPRSRDQSMRWGWGRGVVSTATPPKPFAEAAARSANWSNHRRNPATVPDQLTVPFPHQRNPSPALFTIQSASIIHQELQLIQPAWAFLSHYRGADWNGFKLQQCMYGRTRGETFSSEPAGQVNIYRGCQRKVKER